MLRSEAVKLSGFLLVAGALVVVLSAILTPFWNNWGESDTGHGLYRQPDNTIQVIFAGTSQVGSGISANEIWRQEGICAYSVSSASQPLLASCFWVKEVYRLHSDSLRVVVLDASSLVYDESEKRGAAAEKAVASMEYLPSRWQALMEIDGRYNGGSDVLAATVPAIRYHDRWDELESAGLHALFDGSPNVLTRGQEVRYANSLAQSASKMYVPRVDITDAIDSPRSDIDAVRGSMGELDAFDEIVSFCRENGLELLLVKIPKREWTDARHDAVKEVAEERDVPYVDLSNADFMAQMGVVPPADYIDAKHPNVSGAQKISAFIGGYLREHYMLESKKGDGAYRFMDDCSEFYDRVLAAFSLQRCDSLGEYLDSLDFDRYTVFASVQGDISKGLDDRLRGKLGDVGLEKLAKIKAGDSYVAAVNSDGKREVLVHEGSAILEGSYADGCLEFRAFSEILADGETNSLSSAAQKSIRGYFGLSSGGSSLKEGFSMLVSGSERSEKKDGINFVVYDQDTGDFVDNACFGASDNAKRVTDVVPEEYWEAYREAADSAAEQQASAW